jgi:hypothetical protein
MPEHDFHRVFIGPFERLGIPYMVTGSIAAIFYGEPRLTHDIDIVLHLREPDIGRLCEMFPLESYYCPPPEVIQVEMRRESHAHFNLIHHATGLKADCYPFTGDRLHAWALQNRRIQSLTDSQTVQLAPPEYVIIRKMQYYRDGGSQKHAQDIQAILAVQGGAINMRFLMRELKERNLDVLFNEIPPKQ